jgi:hypothetical protein
MGMAPMTEAGMTPPNKGRKYPAEVLEPELATPASPPVPPAWSAVKSLGLG